MRDRIRKRKVKKEVYRQARKKIGFGASGNGWNFDMKEKTGIRGVRVVF